MLLCLLALRRATGESAPMSLDRDRKQAVLDALIFLLRVADPKQTKKVPGPLRAEAALIARHFPTSEEMAGWGGEQLLARAEGGPALDRTAKHLLWMSEAFIATLSNGLPNLRRFVEAYSRFTDPATMASLHQRVLGVDEKALCAELAAVLDLLNPKPVATL